MIRISALLILLFCGIAAGAQEKEPGDKNATVVAKDSLNITSDKRIIEIETYAARFNPRKALLYSAIFPGMGQVYNRKYWKVPLVYGGFITGAIIIDFDQRQYLRAKRLLFEKLAAPTTTATGTTTTGLTEAQLRNAVNRYRRDRDFWCILTGVWYALQMVDAHVDAHLKEFDINPQLKARVEPMMDSDIMTGRNAGVSLKLKF